MKFRQYIPCSASGFSLVEMMVAIGLSLVIGAVALASFSSTQEVVRYDTKRTSLNQNLRSALDIIGINVRLAGENLPGFFPALVVVNNGSSDTFTIRRSIIDENLVGCQDTGAGTITPILFADDASPEANCSYSNKADVLTAWQTSRVAQGGTGLAYIYSRASNQGEWFEWSGENDSGTQMWITPDAIWTNPYSALHTFAYVLEEWEFSLNGDTLQMVIDGDTANPINVVNGLTGFDVSLELNDGTIVSSYSPGQDWSNVALVNVALTGQEVSGGQTLSRTLQGSFFPRNVLSN